jgi:predicted ATPase
MYIPLSPSDLPVALYGRDQHMQLLMDSFRAVQLSGNSEVCVVSGYSGAGKTFLVREAMDRMIQEGAQTAYAKFDQFNQDVPYTAMVHSLLLSDKGPMYPRYRPTIIL